MNEHEDSFPEQYGGLLRSGSSVSPSLSSIEVCDSDDTSKNSTDGTAEDSTNGTAEDSTNDQSGYLRDAAVEEFVDSLLSPDGRFKDFASGFLDSMSAGAKVYTPRDRAKSSVNIWDPDGLGYDSEEKLIRLRRNQPLEDTQSEEEFRVFPVSSAAVSFEEPTESSESSVYQSQHPLAVVGSSDPYESDSCSYDAGSEGSVPVPRPKYVMSPGKRLFLEAYGGGLFADSRSKVPGSVREERRNYFIARRLAALDSPTEQGDEEGIIQRLTDSDDSSSLRTPSPSV
jgi:hypothetical protein